MKENVGQKKNKESLLKEYYLSAQDLMIIIPYLKLNKARKYINELQEEMKEQNLFIPESKTKLVSTKLVKKKFGL